MISLINFIHSDPLYLALKKKRGFSRSTPRKNYKLLMDGKVDAAMISLIPFLKAHKDLELAEAATIYSESVSLSTILISKGQSARKEMRIAITEHTDTTSLYLEMILKTLGISYKLSESEYRDAESLLSEEDYALVIGDEALQTYNSGNRLIFDIGDMFNRLFSLCPVFSVTARRSESPPTDGITILTQAAYDSLHFIEASVKKNSENYPEDLLRKYYNLIKYDYNSRVNSSIKFVRNYLYSSVLKDKSTNV